MKNLKSKRGFTLVEILIVIAIIGILASIALIGLGGSRVKARDAKRIAEVKQIQTALELYTNRCGHYPGDNACGAAAPADGAALANVLNGSGLGVTNVPTKDPNGTPYLYALSANGQSYIIGAELEADNQVLQAQRDNAIDSGGFTPSIDCSVTATKFTYCVKS